MNPVELGIASVACAGGMGGAVGVLAPARRRPLAVGCSTVLVGLGGLLAGVAALGGCEWSATLPGLLPLGQAQLAVDPLSGVFLLLVGAVGIAAGVYHIGYAAPGGHQAIDPRGTGAASRTTQAMLPIFLASMLLVPAAASVSTLLVAWELMALSSLILVLAEHRARPAVTEAGLWYAGMTQAGFVAILGGLVLFAAHAEGESFTALRQGGAGMPPTIRSLVFVLVLLGFGCKAGMVPLHVWLPRAHPEAPSHVSALMSAAMVKLGVYGLIRVWFDLLGGGPRWWGVLVLALGALSALHGVLQAGVATDLKRLLGYSTTENVGLILIGVGAAGVFAAQSNRTLASLLLAAAVLHAVNHAAFKSLLFLGAGSVLRATGLRDLDRLGGLAARMPITTVLFALGSLCAAALPLGNGFVSEWLLLQGLIHSLAGPGSPTVLIAVAMPLAVAAVALTAGLGAVMFVNAFGVGFLARPRSPEAANAAESPRCMQVGMGLAGAACAGLAVLPAVAALPLARVLSVLPSVRDGAPLRHSGVGLHLAGIAGSMSPLVILAGLLIGAVASSMVARQLGRGMPRRAAPIWGCGGTRLDPRMECTATSFAEPLTRVFEDVLRPESELDVTAHPQSRYLIEAVHYRRRVSDRIEARLYPPVLAAANWWGERARTLANGSVHRYLAVGFLGLLGVLVMIGFGA